MLFRSLVADVKWKERLRFRAAKWDDLLAKSPENKQRAANAIVQSILCNDYTMTKVENFRVGFIEKYRHDRVDSLKWENNQFPRAKDPQSFKWFESHLRGNDGVGGKSGKLVEEGGRRYYIRGRYRHWIEGDVLHREAVPA